MTKSPEEVPTPERAEQILKDLAGSVMPGSEHTIPAMPEVVQGLPDVHTELTAELYRTLLNQVPAVTFMTSFEEGRQMVYVSPQIKDILGYTPEEWLANPSLWYDSLHSDDKERWNQEFADTVVSKGEAVRSVYRFLHRDGSVVVVLGDVRIRRDEESGNPLFVQAVGFDVTDLKRQEEELLKSQRRENARIRSRLKKEIADDMVGSSEPMMKLRKDIRKFAKSAETVLIRGESGTGKQLVAGALHYSGPRAKKRFLEINCPAVPESLLESELFGHEKGAFTGATQQHIGLFEQAQGGTVFLDEIGDMSFNLQSKVLRIIETKGFRRVGGNKDLTADVRIVAATNQPLERLIQEKTFREDLFYRLNIITLKTPPLRERTGDIPQLVEHFIEEANQAEKLEIREASPEAMDVLMSHGWAGNVRELQAAIKRAALSCDGRTIGREDLPEHLHAKAAPKGLVPARAGDENLVDTIERLEKSMIDAVIEKKVGLIDAVEHLERSMIEAALQKSGGVQAKAARNLRIGERVLAYKMDKLGIEKPQQK